MNNKKGFTLIELLAVIIILGILMIIAIPSVTKYISDSRKSAYIDTAKQIISGGRNLVNSGEYEMYDTSATYYISNKCIKTEGANKSPYGEFVKAYVLVTYDGNGYDYYWTSVDDAGQGVKDIIKSDKLEEDKIVSDIKVDEINPDTVVGGRKKVKIIDDNCSMSDGTALKKVPARGGTRAGIDETCYKDPVITIYSDKTGTIRVGEEISIYHEISGFDRCSKIDFEWQFRGALTNNEWDAISNYNIDWIVRNTPEVLTFIANANSIVYDWRVAAVADF